MSAASARPLHNRFQTIPDATLQRCLEFARRNPETVSPDQVIEKLMILDSLNPLLDDLFRGGKILEVGCGSGFQSALLTARGAVSATELEHTVGWLGTSINDTRQRIVDALAEGKVDFRFNDGVSLPFEDETFDMVFHNSVIEHVPDVGAFNREIQRVLKPGGLCVCVTGTPVLVRLRFVRRFCLLSPAITAHAAFSALATSGLMRDLPVLRRLSAHTRSWHLIPAHRRVEEIIDEFFDGRETPSSIPTTALRRMYPRLRHFLRDPHYNRLVIDRLAAAHQVPAQALLRQLASHFRSPWNEFLFRMTVPTHGQHTRNFRTEMREWDIQRWIDTFAAAGMTVEAVRGFRYQHIFEPTLSKRLNSRIAYRALPMAREIARRLPASFSSEFILVARKPAALRAPRLCV